MSKRQNQYRCGVQTVIGAAAQSTAENVLQGQKPKTGPDGTEADLTAQATSCNPGASRASRQKSGGNVQPPTTPDLRHMQGPFFTACDARPDKPLPMIAR